jgi:hypothetical protein
MTARRANQSGAVMIMIIISMVLASIVGVAMVDLTTTATLGQLSATHQDRAYYLAESGGRYAIIKVRDDIKNGVTTNIDLLHNQTFTLDHGNITNGQFLIEVDTSDPDYVFVHSTGIINAGISLPARTKITYRLARIVAGPFRYGGFGRTGITLKNDARINGDAGTNAASTKITVEGGAVITGNQDGDVAMQMAAIPFPPGSYTSNLILQEETDTLTVGTYNYGEMKITENGVLRISGDVTINIDNQLMIEMNAQIIILADSSLTIYAADRIDITGDAEINKNGDAADVIIYQCRAEDIVIQDNAVINAGLYAPKSRSITIEDDADITGAVAGKSMKLTDRAEITYDPSLSGIQTLGGSSMLDDPIQYYAS